MQDESAPNASGLRHVSFASSRSTSVAHYATFSFVPTQKWVIGDKNDEKFNFPLTKSFFAKIYLN